MYDQRETVATRTGRTVWKRPEVRRLEAGKAELGGNPGGDGLSQSS